MADHRFPFPDLDTLEVREIDKSRDRKTRAFWNRVIAFYDYVRAQTGIEAYPHPSGVRVHEDDDRRLHHWCAEPLKLRSERQFHRQTGMAWLNKGPAIDDEATPGMITVVHERAYPDEAQHG